MSYEKTRLAILLEDGDLFSASLGCLGPRTTELWYLLCLDDNLLSSSRRAGQGEEAGCAVYLIVYY